MKTLFTEAERAALREVTVVGREWDSAQGRRKVLAVQSLGGREVAVVQTGDQRIGHLIIPVADLEKEIDFETRQYQSKQKNQATVKAHQAAQAQAHHTATSLDGFEDTLTPKKRGVAVRALTKKGITSEGQLYRSIRDLVRARVKDGWMVKGSGPSRRFTGPDGAFLIQKDITKIGMDYAAYFSSKH